MLTKVRNQKSRQKLNSNYKLTQAKCFIRKLIPESFQPDLLVVLSQMKCVKILICPNLVNVKELFCGEKLAWTVSKATNLPK
jgi:hypothetical protein